MTETCTTVVLSQHHPADHEQFEPWSSSALKPRAFSRSDARELSLNGHWRFRLSSCVGPADFHGRSFDDTDWRKIIVPSHWVLEGHGKPYYTNLEYPFVVNPPRVPTDNPTGDYRRTFKLGPAWPSTGKVSSYSSC